MIGEFKHTRTKTEAGHVDQILMLFFENSYPLVCQYESEKRLSEGNRQQHNLRMWRKDRAKYYEEMTRVQAKAQAEAGSDSSVEVPLHLPPVRESPAPVLSADDPVLKAMLAKRKSGNSYAETHTLINRIMSTPKTPEKRTSEDPGSTLSPIQFERIAKILNTEPRYGMGRSLHDEVVEEPVVEEDLEEEVKIPPVPPKPYYRPAVERSIDFSAFLNKYMKHDPPCAHEEWEFSEEAGKWPDTESWIDNEDF